MKIKKRKNNFENDLVKLRNVLFGILACAIASITRKMPAIIVEVMMTADVVLTIISTEILGKAFFFKEELLRPDFD